MASKLHLVVNDRGELLNIILTPGNTDDRTPVPKLLLPLFGKVFALQGYVSQKLAKQLLNTAGIQLITKQRAQHETAINTAQRPSDAQEAFDYRNYH